ncbi:hypothetical protein N431DRAFT_124395 [Stipitochalara longipes BDJ]|nr:hypothetical protein N431DRAFT_124395 [Stipitochalara longipes BDJ]
MLEEIRCWGFSSQVSLRVCPALLSAFLSRFRWTGVFSEASARHPPKTAGGAAPLHNPQGIGRSHRRKVDLKPVLLDIDQPSTPPHRWSYRTSVRAWLIRSPTNSRAQGCLISMSPEKSCLASDLGLCNDSEDLYRCMWQYEKFLFTLSSNHP